VKGGLVRAALPDSPRNIPDRLSWSDDDEMEPMNDHEQQKKDADHWRKLAEEFGLPLEAEPKAEPVRPSVSEAHEPEEFAFQPAPDSVHHARLAGREQEIPREAELPEAMTQPAEHLADEAMEEAPKPDAMLSGEAVDREEDRPSRGRRRRRRSGKGRQRGESDRDHPRELPEGEDSAELSPGAARSAEAPEAAGDRGPRRRRGHRERKPRESEPVRSIPDEDVDFADDELPAEEGAPVSALDDEDDEDIALTNWSVPSWQELISSLYRPER
jgi:hypothetical protein